MVKKIPTIGADLPQDLRLEKEVVHKSQLPIYLLPFGIFGIGL